MPCSCPGSSIKTARIEYKLPEHVATSSRPRTFEYSLNYPMDCYERWTPRDQIEFNRYAIDECPVICQWVDQRGVCDERVLGKGLTSHFNNCHAVTSESGSYQCLWRDCGCSRKLKKTSLMRHIKEQHLPIKWACPHCDETFTRERTMMGHIRRSPDHPLDSE